MNADQFAKMMSNDYKVQVGDLCRVRWTNCYNQYEATAKLIKRNYKSNVLELTEPVNGYPIGQIIRVPNAINWKLWSPNNCISPI